MITKEQIQRVGVIGHEHEDDYGIVQNTNAFVAEMKRLALLGLAVRESGVTAEDLDPSQHQYRVYRERVYRMLGALEAALREEPGR